MKRIIGASLAGLAALAFAAPADAATKPSEIDGRIVGGGNDTAFVLGAVLSNASACEDRRKVTLIAEIAEGEARKRLGTDRASRNGGFFFAARIPPNTTDLIVSVDRDRVSKRLTCGAAASSVGNL